MGLNVFDILRDGPCISFPNVHDSSVVQLSVEQGNFLEVTLKRECGERISFRVDGLLEFGVTEYVDGAGVGEVFLVSASEMSNMYIDGNARPWKLVKQSISSEVYLKVSEENFILENPNALFFWIECNFSGYIAAIGSKVTSYSRM